MSQKIKFAIVAGQRTGSTLLGDLLNAHPAVTCDGEVFVKKVWREPFPHLDQLQEGSGSTVYGFLLKLGFLNDLSPNLSQQLVQQLFDREWRLIFLRRRNHLRQALSASFAYTRGRWHDLAADGRGQPKVTIDPALFFRFLRAFEVADLYYRAVMRRFAHLPLVYEDDLLPAERHQETADRIFHDIGIPTAPVYSKYRRTSSGNMADFIENYNQLIAGLTLARHKQLLEQA